MKQRIASIAFHPMTVFLFWSLGAWFGYYDGSWFTAMLGSFLAGEAFSRLPQRV